MGQILILDNLNKKKQSFNFQRPKIDFREIFGYNLVLNGVTRGLENRKFLGVIFSIEATFGYNHYDGIFPILVGIVML